ncbi:uncharacterized protein ACIB01_008262 isoform 1-T5 [Guaruba guarouba]
MKSMTQHTKRTFKQTRQEVNRSRVHARNTVRRKLIQGPELELDTRLQHGPEVHSGARDRTGDKEQERSAYIPGDEAESSGRHPCKCETRKDWILRVRVKKEKFK